MDRSNLWALKKLPTITSKRLVFRKMLPSDDEDMFEYAQNPAVTRYLLWEPHISKKFTRSYLRFIQSQYSAGTFFDWALTLAENGKMIGTCGFSYIDKENNSAEVGYVLNPSYWGRGIASEALFRVMEFGFIELDLNRIYVRIMEGNTASERVAVRCGMRHEATLRKSMFIKNEYRTIKIYALLREEFLRMR